MQKNILQSETKRKSAKLVGRGGKRGKTAGRGTKGQSARAGNKKRPELRDIIKKLPKLRGYKFNSVQNEVVSVTLGRLEKVLENGQKVTPQTLVDLKLVNTSRGKVPKVKLLSAGVFTKAIHFSKFAFSESAKEIIEKNKGTLK